MGKRIALKGVIILGFWALMQCYCTQPPPETKKPQAQQTVNHNQDCISELTGTIVTKALKLYQDIRDSDDWATWGIDENEKKIKIWVLPPRIGFEDSMEILYETSADVARLHLKQIIENSLGNELEKQNAHFRIQVVENSGKTVDQLVDLISGKYSRKVYESDVYREIGKISKANFVMKVEIMTDKSPVIMAYLQSIEKGTKQCFSGDISIGPGSCPQNISRQFQLLREKPTPGNPSSNFSTDYFKKQISEFIASRLSGHKGPIFIEKIKQTPHNRLTETVNFNHLEYVHDLILSAVSHHGNPGIFSARDVLSGRQGFKREYARLKQSSRIWIYPGISWIKPRDRGLRFEVSLALMSNDGSLIAQDMFTLDLEYNNNRVKICEIIEGDKNNYQNRLAARLRIYKKAAERVAGVFYFYDQINGDEARSLFRGETSVRFNNAVFNERAEGDSLCIDIDLDRIYNTYPGRRK